MVIDHACHKHQEYDCKQYFYYTIVYKLIILILGQSTMRQDFASPSPHLQQTNQVVTFKFSDVIEVMIEIMIICTGSLSISEFPVFTMYAEKICLQSACNKPWSFETVNFMTNLGRVLKNDNILVFCHPEGS